MINRNGKKHANRKCLDRPLLIRNRDRYAIN